MIDTTKKARPRRLGEDVLLTTGEVAELLRMTTPAVRDLINSGQLPAVRANRHYRVWKSDLDALLTRSRVGI